MRRPSFAVAAVAVAVSGAVACDLKPGLSSDPAHWDPALVGAAVDGAAPAADAAVLPGCDGVPPFSPGLGTSAAGLHSHFAGQPCLEACHEEGGTARKVFAVGGTVHRAAGSREVAPYGEVFMVGNTTLTADACGNFYAVKDALELDPRQTLPYVKNPVLRHMTKTLSQQENPGSCNQSGCHDFGSKLRWGIYY